MNDIPQRRRALDRIYADLVATNALNGIISNESIQRLFERTDPRGIVRWIEDERQKHRMFFQSQARSARLWIFAPVEEVRVLSRLGSVLWFVGLMPVFLLGSLMTAPLPVVRWASRRYMEEVEKDKASSTKPKGKIRR